MARGPRAEMKALGWTGLARLVLRIALYGGALSVGGSLAFSYVLTAPFRPRATNPPPTGYSAVWFSSDGLKLRAWLAQGDSAKVVLGFLAENQT